jgi:hypothetical protein
MSSFTLCMSPRQLTLEIVMGACIFLIVTIQVCDKLSFQSKGFYPVSAFEPRYVGRSQWLPVFRWLTRCPSRPFKTLEHPQCRLTNGREMHDTGHLPNRWCRTPTNLLHLTAKKPTDFTAAHKSEKAIEPSETKSNKSYRQIQRPL